MKKSKHKKPYKFKKPKHQLVRRMSPFVADRSMGMDDLPTDMPRATRPRDPKDTRRVRRLSPKGSSFGVRSTAY